jgi:hypothetical protein
MIFNNSLLTSELIRYKATLVGWSLPGNKLIITTECPKTLNRETEIHYKCECGKENKKTFRVLQKYGAYCKGCQRNITANKNSILHTKWTPTAIKDAVDELGVKLRYTCKEDWYKVKQADFNENGLSGLIVGRYGGSPSRLLLSVYSDYPWNMILFKTKPQGFWKNPDNATLGLEHIKYTKKWSSLNDFYNLSREDIELHCSGLWDMFSSIIGVLKYAYPLIEWKAIHLRTITKGTFDDIENHLQVVKDLELELGITKPEEWLGHISYDLFSSRGYGNLLKCHYNHSPSELIFTVYPKMREQIHLLGRVPKNCYDDPTLIKMMMKGFELAMGITTPEGYYNVSCMDIQNYFGTGIERRGGIDGYGGLINFIIEVVEVPNEFVWDRSKFLKHKTEGKLSAHLDAISIRHTTQSRHPWLKCSIRSSYRFDEELTDLKTMLELDGPQHFTPIWKWGDPEQTMTNDVIKMKKAFTNGFSGVRLYQPDVFSDSLDWKGWLSKAFDYIKSSATPIWVFPQNDIYKKHIKMCDEYNIQYKILE